MSIFFFNDTAPTEISTLSLHDALPICKGDLLFALVSRDEIAKDDQRWHISLRHKSRIPTWEELVMAGHDKRSEEHTSELQSRPHLVCRLLLEKKKIKKRTTTRRDTTRS